MSTLDCFYGKGLEFCAWTTLLVHFNQTFVCFSWAQSKQSKSIHKLWFTFKLSLVQVVGGGKTDKSKVGNNSLSAKAKQNRYWAKTETSQLPSLEHFNWLWACLCWIVVLTSRPDDYRWNIPFFLNSCLIMWFMKLHCPLWNKNHATSAFPNITNIYSIDRSILNK